MRIADRLSLIKDHGKLVDILPKFLDPSEESKDPKKHQRFIPYNLKYLDAIYSYDLADEFPI
jgi:hypothetical protein